jgi:hypothetical protein
LNQPAIPPARSLGATIRRRRHALIGTASALGLILVPLTGGAVVMGVTSTGRPPAVVTQIAAPPPASAPPTTSARPAASAPPATAPAPLTVTPVVDARRGRRGR